MPDQAKPGELLQDEEAVIRLLAPLTQTAGAFALEDDCAIFRPRPGTDLVLKTDPIAEGVHFLADTKPADVAWKALAVNISDLAAKGAVPSALSGLAPGSAPGARAAKIGSSRCTARSGPPIIRQ